MGWETTSFWLKCHGCQSISTNDSGLSSSFSLSFKTLVTGSCGYLNSKNSRLAILYKQSPLLQKTSLHRVEADSP